jgi:hypothetical protein
VRNGTDIHTRRIYHVLRVGTVTVLQISAPTLAVMTSVSNPH